MKKKNVKIVLCDPPNSLCDENAFEVKKVVNTLQVKVGEYVDEQLVKKWIKDHENWTIEFVRQACCPYGEIGKHNGLEDKI